ncbi:ABC transporter permease subunit [Mycoplasmatota bacterium]|nr:ABC transporter permease subunit [Mycoplasmatota bacterium]
MKKHYILVSSFLTLFIIWYILYLVVDQPMLLPSMSEVWISLLDIIFSKDILIILTSLFRLLIAFFIACSLGIVLGFLSAKYHWLEYWQHPYVSILRTIPVISIIVILYILLGDQITVYVITFLMIFPLFYEATLDIIKRIDPYLIDALKLDEVHFKESLIFVYTPILKEQLKVTVVQSLGLGIKVLVMAEYLTQAKYSIGSSIYLAKINLDYVQVYAWTIILLLIIATIKITIKGINKAV